MRKKWLIIGGYKRQVLIDAKLTVRRDIGCDGERRIVYTRDRSVQRAYVTGWRYAETRDRKACLRQPVDTLGCCTS